MSMTGLFYKIYVFRYAVYAHFHISHVMLDDDKIDLILSS